MLWVLGVACSGEPPPSDYTPGQGNADSGVVEDATGEEDARAPTEPREVTVATYNVYLLFDTTCDSRRCGPNDFEQQPTQQEFEARISQVAQAIDELNADVVMLQEVENQEVLDALNAELQDPYPIAELGESGYAGSIDAAILARGDVIDVEFHTQLNKGRGNFTRPLVQVDVELDGRRAIFFAAHFKSRFNDDGGRRIAEAETTRELVMKAAADHHDALVVLGGDLNDEPDSEALRALTDDGGLLRVAEEKHMSEVYTFVFRDKMIAIDHLLLAPNQGGRYVEGSVHSLHDANPVGYGGSDHGALVARFKMR